MKTVIIFIGLKLAELAGAAAAIYGLYWIGKGANLLLFGNLDDHWLLCVLTGAVCISLIVALVLIVCGLGNLIEANWRKAKELSKKW